MFKSILLIITASLLLYLFNSGSSYAEKEEMKIGVVVSILPEEEFVEKIGGERVLVTVMVPPGANPHHYEPKPSQLLSLSKAKVYVKVGTPIEFELSWIDKLISMNPKMDIIDMSKGVELIKLEEDLHNHGINIDPHIWLSLRSVMVQVENIYSGLVKIDPPGAKFYKTNLENYLTELKSTDKSFSELFKSIKNRKFMVFHPSFGYFARDYGLTEVPVEIEGKEPTAKQMVSLVDTARKEGIKAIFASPEFSLRSAEVIASQIGGKVVVVDPLAKNYLENMKKMALAISKALN